MKNKLLLISVLLIVLITTSCTKQDNYEDVTEQSTSEVSDDSSKYGEVNKLEGVIMTVESETVSSTGLTVVFKNTSEMNCIYGEFYALEVKSGDRWVEVPITFDGNYGFSAIGYQLDNDGSSEWSTNWEWLYGVLEPGDYRIIKDILDFRDTGDYDQYYLSAEFSI